MADSNANLTGAPSVIGARAMRSRSNTPALLHDVVAVGARAMRPRLRAALHTGDTAPPVQFVMRAQRIDASPGPVCWVVTGAPDATGAQYPDGPGVLDAASIACVGHLP